MDTKSHAATRQHEALREAYMQAIRKKAASMPADQILAVTCVFVGQLIALQDQRKFSPDMIMQLVKKNIEAGNQRVIADLLKSTRGNG
jgi:uncharacterized membrane protein YvbJ